jgi:hypothetical protein
LKFLLLLTLLFTISIKANDCHESWQRAEVFRLQQMLYEMFVTFKQTDDVGDNIFFSSEEIDLTGNLITFKGPKISTRLIQVNNGRAKETADLICQQLGYLSSTDFSFEESSLNRRDFDYTYRLIDTAWSRQRTGSFFNRSSQVSYLTSLQCRAPQAILDSSSDDL